MAQNISNAISQHLRNFSWKSVYYEINDRNPIHIAVFKMNVEPNKFWRNNGVTNQFTIYNVMLAYSNMEKCMSEMAHHLKKDKALCLKWKNTTIDLGRESQIIGYIGHNIYYGGFCEIDNLELLLYESNMSKGLFFLGCQSAKWCRDKLVSPSVANYLFCNTNMAPEGYIMLAFLDGISRGLADNALVDICNRVYGIAQGQGEKIRLFVNSYNSQTE